MTVYIIAGLILALFVVGFWITKSGRLTVYMLALDGILIKAEPIFDAIMGYDLSTIMSQSQQGWLVLLVTILAAISRKRRQIKAMAAPIPPVDYEP